MNIKKLFLFISLFWLCNLNCLAEVKLISTEEDLKNISNGTDNSITEIKLINDINFKKSFNFYLTDTPLVFDLNGYTMDMGDKQIQFHYGHASSLMGNSYNTGSLTLTDTSNSKQGKIITKEGIFISYNILNKLEDIKNYTLNIEGGTYISNDTNINNGRRCVFNLLSSSTKNYNINFNLNVIIGIFKSLSPYSAYVFSTPTTSETDMVMNFKIDSMFAYGYGLTLANNTFGSKKISDTINSGYSFNETIYNNDKLEKNKITDDNTLLKEINGGLTNNGYIKVEKTTDIEIDDIDITTNYGYNNIKKILSIKNNGNDDLIIKNINTNDSKLINISGDTNKIISAGSINNDYEISLVNDLEVGNYTAVIILEDSLGNLYYVNVSINIEKKAINGLGIGFDRSWFYGENAPSLTLFGVDDLSTNDYKITYAVKDSDNWSEDMPKNAGEYSAKIEIINDNYVNSSAISNFIINKSERIVKIVANSSAFTYDGESHSDNGYKIYFDGNLITDGKLLYDDIIDNIVVTGSVKYVSDNTSNNNVIDINSISNDIKNNYNNIEYVNGTLRVNPKSEKIIVTASSDEKIYDGVELKNNNYTYTENILVSGDTLEATITGSRMYAGKSDNVVTSVKVMNGNKDVTDNYSFGSHINGTLKVKSAMQTFNLNKNIYVRVNKTLTIEKIKELLNSNVSDYTINKLNGTAGTFSNTQGFKAGTTEGQVLMEAIAPQIDLNNDGEPEYLNSINTFTINVIKKEEVVFSGINDNQTFEYSGSAFTPIGNITSNKQDFDINSLNVLYKGTGNTIYNSSNAPKNAGTYEVTYSIPDSNDDYFGSVTYSFEITKKVVNKIDVSNKVFEYNKNTLGYPNLISNNIININGVVTSINVGNYTFTISLIDKDNYIWNNSSSEDYQINWSIIKANPTYNIPTNLEGINGQLLKSIRLPEGFSWENGDQVLQSGINLYKAKFTPSDIDNYNIISDLEIEVLVKNVNYNFIENNINYIINKDNYLKFRIDADYNLFDNHVYIDNILIDKNNYTSESGSTIITLKKEYLDTLSKGVHDIKVVFSDNGIAYTTFNILEDTSIKSTPKTLDNINKFIVMLFISTSGLFILRKKIINRG